MADQAFSEHKESLLEIIKEIEDDVSRVIIFALEDNIAFACVGVSNLKDDTPIEELALPLDMPSCFVRAIEWKMKSAGSYRALTPCEKGFFRYSKVEVPTFFMALPLFSASQKAGELPKALLYIEKVKGSSDQKLLSKVETVQELCAEYI